MSEWKEVVQDRSQSGYCRERWTLVVECTPDGKPAVWVSAMRRVDSLGGFVTFWEMALCTPRTGPKRWESDDVDIVTVGGLDLRAECVGKTREELARMFAGWGAAWSGVQYE